MKKTEPEYYPPVENLLDLIYEHYTENNPVEKNTVAGKAAKAKEKELEEWMRGLEGMDRLVDDYVGDKIPLWEKIMDRQGTVCCAWENSAAVVVNVYRTSVLAAVTVFTVIAHIQCQVVRNQTFVRQL